MTVKDENEKQNLEPDSVFSAGEHDADEEMDSMHDLYEQSFRNFQEGEVVRGRIVQVSDDFVMVDIGYKSEGQIPIYEFRDETGKVKAVIGDEIDVLLEFHDDDDGSIHLSKEKAAKIKVWDDISRIYSDDGIIEGKVTAKVKGGLAVDIGVQAFLPGSQVDLRPVRNLESLIGHIFAFKVLKYNKKRRNVVLSRRALLEKEREQMKSTTLSALEDNKVVEGIVKNITDYGVFVDLGGIDGLLHITDMSWGRVGHPSEMFQIGDKIQVKVLSFDRETERVSLGLKQLVSDPWTRAEGKYPVGAKVQGKVVSLTDYGAFIEIEEGVEGLIHVSEMSWTKKVRHPSKFLSVGDEVEAVVLSINPESKRPGIERLADTVQKARNLGVHGAEAYAKSGESVGLGKCPQNDYRRRLAVYVIEPERRIRIGVEFYVGFVENDRRALGHPGEKRFEIGLADYLARRVVRVGEENDFRFRSNRFGHLVQVDPPVFLERYGRRPAAHPLNDQLVEEERRLGHHHFVARAHKGPDDQFDDFV